MQRRRTALEVGMSKERELLVRIYRFLESDVENDFGLGSDIRELLTQPEPIKEREVLGKIISTDDVCNWNLTVGGLKDYDHVYVNGIRYTEYQPDINTQYLLDLVARLTSENAMLKEKWLAQPEHIVDVTDMVEQEPVAWKVIDGTHGGYMFSRIKPTEHTYKYNVVIPLYTSPPKREPLSDGEITKNTPKLIHIGERLAFYAGVKFAEKIHGIGGG